VLNKPSGRIDEMFEKHADTVYRVALSQTNQQADAEDVFQEVFVKLFATDTVFQSDEHIKAWLIRVTINKCRDLHKSAWNKKTVELTPELTDVAHESIDMDHALARLPLHYRSVIHLFYFEDMSIAQIAKTLQANENTVKTWLSRARKLLKVDLEGSLDNV